ncbi:MAG TPA: metallophosphoesterase [Candidatus Sulfomarinibacteraceae bacterium]|nr:metallophosphoesterase [Candidatus Sulfomarinibacteraceae bacterium]
MSDDRRKDGEKNILELSLLHRAMEFFEQPQSWAVWRVALLAMLLAGGMGLAWRAASAPVVVAFAAGALLLLFFAADSLLLRYLPRRRISFGPWKAQAIVLLLPRAATGAALALVGAWAGWAAALLALLALQLLGLALLWWGAVVEPQRLSLTRLEVTLPGLPADAPPVRLLHISDIHLERITAREEALLALAASAEPDAIVITGDYVNLSYNRDEKTLSQVRGLLQRLRAPHGVYATLGSPPVDLRQTVAPLFEDLPVCLLRDGWAALDLGQGRRLVILGVDCTHHLDEDGQRLHEVVSAAPNGVPRLLLYHSPELMPQAAAHGLDLYLCGHTHGGQVRLPLLGPILTSSQLGRRYVMGHYREGSTQLYVSRGVGLEGLSAPRVRFLAPPEITLVEVSGLRKGRDTEDHGEGREERRRV